MSDERGRLVRAFGGPGMEHANALVGRWMAEAGMGVRVDAARNLVCASHTQICNGADLCAANRSRQYPGMLRAHYSAAHDANSKRHSITFQSKPSAATPPTRGT